MASVSERLAMAIAHHRAGRLHAAEQIYRELLEAQPHDPEVLHLLGVVAHQVGHHEIAVNLIQTAIRENGATAAFHSNLGEAYRALWRFPEAIKSYHRALELKPDYAEAHNNLGNALGSQGKIAEAASCFEHAARLQPQFAQAHINLGHALVHEARLGEVIACYRRALKLKPDARLHSDLLYLLNFCAEYDVEEILAEHRGWNRQYAAPLAHYARPHVNDPHPHRRLRIGYVSADFCGEPVGWFMLPLLQEHDHKSFEIVCYASVGDPDEITDACRACADMWRDVLGTSDEDLAALIRDDKIDILVDLTMHAEGSRLLAFARKPAPVQITYLAYCGTTGMDAVGYRLTDPFLDPCRQTTAYSEECIWLPETYWCYRPPHAAPETNDLPALKATTVTFGCLNSFFKVSEQALDTWCRLLNLLPRTRMLLHVPRAAHKRARSFFDARGIASERLTLVDHIPLSEYFHHYQQIDIALDPFPYGGGTTTCDALWMGVPVISLAGERAVGRAGTSILSNVGLPELIAGDAEEYLRLAAELAGDLPRLRLLRSTMRNKMQRSPLMDAPRFARAVESAYRTTWQRWCVNSLSWNIAGIKGTTPRLLKIGSTALAPLHQPDA